MGIVLQLTIGNDDLVYLDDFTIADGAYTAMDYQNDDGSWSKDNNIY